MNDEIKAKWVAALRSGEFKQGHGGLRDGDRFCCLGVLCEIHRRIERGKRKWKKMDESPFKWYLDNYQVLPGVVQNWAGLEHENPATEQGALAELNDDGLDFDSIADIIEAEL